MKARVPVVYSASAVPKGARNPRTYRFGEWIEVEFATPSDLEAPVALHWKADEYGRDGLDGVEQRRWYAGMLWEPMVYSAANEPNVQVTLEGMLEDTANGHGYANPLLSYMSEASEFARRRRDEPLDPAAFRSVAWSERDEKIAEAEARAAAIIAVDGKVWIQASEPAYRIRSNLGFRTYLAVDIVKAEDGEEGDLFRADRFDDMTDHILARHGREADDVRRIQVFVPECIRFDDETPAALKALRQAVSRHHESIAEEPRQTVMAWLDLRDATSEAERTRGAEEISAAMEAAEAWLAVAPEGASAERLAHSVRRWSMRPIENAEMPETEWKP